MAQQCNDRGLALVEKGELPDAERQFKRALDHDLYYASAHNNLGLVLLRTKRYYEAAWEFECAAKLAPHSPEPRANLGLLYEEIGRLDSAIQQYETALTIEPESTATMRHLARAQVKAGRKTEELKTLLERLLLSAGDPQWDVWVRGQIVRMGRAEDPDARLAPMGSKTVP